MSRCQVEPQAKQSAGASRNWLHFQRLLSRLVTFNLTIAPSLKVRVCWSRSNVAASAKSRAFRNLGLWCDLWLGSLVCSSLIWGVKAEDWGRFVTLKGLKIPNNRTVMVFWRQGSSLSTKTIKNLWPSRSFFSRWLSMATLDEFPLLWVGGCELKAQVLLNQVPFHKMKMIQEDQNGRGEWWNRKELKRNQNLLDQQSAWSF